MLTAVAGATLIASAAACGSDNGPASAAAEGPEDEARPAVTLTHREAERRVDIAIDGAPFTSYLWPDTLKKPVLHPIYSADGAVVTRGFPPGPGERADHPHHVGLWLNFGNVNGFDFWNNSDAVSAERQPRMGTILHEAVTEVDEGPGEGRLGVEMVWRQGDGVDVLREQTTFVVRAAPGVRMIDRLTTLVPLAGPVRMGDTTEAGAPNEAAKEGVLGLRVARALEDPGETGGQFTDASGAVTRVADMDMTGVTGRYTSSEGVVGPDVWGTRGRWMMLAGTVDGHPTAVAILDAPGNPGFPTYWHARGYGLFAANPLGQAVFSEGRERLDFVIEPERPATFRYRVLILSGAPSAVEIDEYFRQWTAEVEE